MVLTKCNNCSREFRTESQLLSGTACFKICSDNNLWFECSCHSSLMIPEGEYTWYNPEHFLSNPARSIFSQLKDMEHFPKVSSDVQKVQKLLADKNADAPQIEKHIKKVPLLALNLMETVNGMLPERDVQTLKHAIGYLGIDRLKNLVSLAGMKSVSFDTKNFSQQAFWNRSIIAGLITEYLAKKFCSGNLLLQEQAYFTACLSNIGKIVQAICFPEKTEKILEYDSDPDCSLTWSELENITDTPDHGVLGEIAGVLWGLPPYALRSIRFHNSSPEEYREELKNGGFLFDEDPVAEEDKPRFSLNQLVCLGVQYSHWVALEPHRINTKIFNSHLKSMGIDHQEKDQLGDELYNKFRFFVSGMQKSA